VPHCHWLVEADSWRRRGRSWGCWYDGGSGPILVNGNLPAVVPFCTTPRSRGARPRTSNGMGPKKRGPSGTRTNRSMCLSPASLLDQTWAKPSTPLGYSSTTAWSPISANRGRGRGRVPDSGQIGDGDGGASPPPGKSGTDAPSPSPDKSGTGTGTGTGVSAPCFKGPEVFRSQIAFPQASVRASCSLVAKAPSRPKA
jgi:hypothetical protein